MRILLTNDDGLEASGLQALLAALAPRHELWVVAPETERSGSSHGITLRDSIRMRCRGERTFSCRGSPVDCVMVALLGFIPEPIDLLLSGINHGPNLGTDILYSGTASAACQGVLMGVPSVALSVGTYAPPFDFRCATGFVERNLAVFVDSWEEDHYLNINFPSAPQASGKPVLTFPSRRIYRDELRTYEAPNKDIFCFLGGGGVPGAHLEEGSDCHALSAGSISLSPISVHPANHPCGLERYRAVEFR
jgi:5'-nucleotidase